MTYSDGTSQTNPSSLTTGQSWLIYQPNVTGLTNAFSGGATVVSTTAKIVGVVSVGGASNVDQLFSTNAFGSN